MNWFRVGFVANSHLLVKKLADQCQKLPKDLVNKGIKEVAKVSRFFRVTNLIK
jgi:hypothetical protein